MPTATAVPPSAPPFAAPAAATPLPGQLLRPPAFFHQRWPAALIVGAFPALALPMAAAVLLSADNLLLWAYVWLLGMTHFVVTLALYMRSENLRYFASTPGNRVVFFLVPVVLLAGFDLYHALRVGAVFPAVGVLVLAAVRLADFNHFNRQSFGVLQLFKARTGAKPAAGGKRTEGLYFLSLTGLLFVTFLAGGTCPLAQPGGPLTVAPLLGELFPALVPLAASQVAWAGLAVAAACLFGAVTSGLWRVARGRGAAVAYVVAQSASALMAAAYFPLYLAGLAVHYVEYHVLMAPRCFRASLDPASRLDRAYGAVRARPVLFYALVIGAAGLVTLTTAAGMGMMGRGPGAAGRPFEYLVLIAVFDGLFAFHYFVEMFVWRFGDPHFRRELSGLYFAPRK
jgi:hypothetical protein